MSRHMRTTVRLDDALLDQARREAIRRGETLTSLMELGLRLVLAQKDRRQHPSKMKLPVSQATGGLMPGIDLNDTAALLDALEETDPHR